MWSCVAVYEHEFSVPSSLIKPTIKPRDLYKSRDNEDKGNIDIGAAIVL